MEHILTGVSKTNITPPLGYRLQGHISRAKASTKIHDPLYLKALTIKKEDERIAILTFDLLGLSTDFISQAREEIRKKTGLLPHQVMMCASHTHSGPFVLPVPDGTMDENFIPEYLPFLVKQTSSAIIEAFNKEVETNMLYGKTEVNIGSINRRKINPDGSVGGPNPEGPVDREVSVLSFEKDEKTPVAIFFNYGCHPTTVSNTIYDITAEYPGAAQYELEKFYQNSISLFSNGCSGDVRPDITDEEGTKFIADGNFQDVQRMGRLLAAGAIIAIETARRKKKSPYLNIDKLSAYLEEYPFPLDKDLLPINKETLEKILPTLVYKFRKTYTPLEAEIRWKELWEKKLKRGDTVPTSINADIQVFKVGPVTLAAFPGDTMSEIGLRLKKEIPNIIPISNANGRIGYIPSAQGLKDGGYEASFFFHQGLPGPYAPTLEDILINKIREIRGTL